METLSTVKNSLLNAKTQISNLGDRLTPESMRRKVVAACVPLPTGNPSPKLNRLKNTAEQIKTKLLGSPNSSRLVKKAVSDFLPPKVEDIKLERMELHKVVLTPPRNRDIYPFQTGYSPARQTSAELTGTVPLGSLSLSELSEDALHQRSAIADDAQRRLQIFYFQCLAYWLSKTHVELGPTLHQHGISDVPGCNAAHPAICPNLQDNYFETLAIQIKDQMTPSLKKLLQTLGANEEGIERIAAAKDVREIKAAILTALQLSEGASLLTLKHHLYHVANATIEGHIYWNDYHDKIEKKLRPDAIALLNECSFGKKPYDCLQIFTQKLRAILKTGQAETIQKMDLVENLMKEINVFNNLRTQLTTRGSLGRVSYVQDCVSSLVKMRTLISDIRKLKDYSLSVDLSPVSSLIHPLQALSPIQLPVINAGRLGAGRGRSMSDSSVYRIGAAYTTLNSYFASHPPIGTAEVLSAKAKLEECALFIYVLKYHSKCPEYAMLSGKLLADGKRRGLSDEELLEQQLEVLHPRYEVVHYPAVTTTAPSIIKSFADAVKGR